MKDFKGNCNSPNKTCDLLKVTIGQVLADMGWKLMYKGRTYEVSQRAPATLVIAVVNGSKSCKVNIVPTLLFPWEKIKGQKIQEKVEDLCQQFGMKSNGVPWPMATVLPGSNKLMFDLGKVVEWLVLSRGCFKKVIKLMENWREVKSRSFTKLPIKLLKVGSDAS